MNRRPVVIGKEEQAGFDNYVRKHYQQALRESSQVVADFGAQDENDNLVKAVFDKMATPRVFLIDKWRNELTDEDRKSYYPPETQDRMKTQAETIMAKAHAQLEGVKP